MQLLSEASVKLSLLSICVGLLHNMNLDYGLLQLQIARLPTIDNAGIPRLHSHSDFLVRHYFNSFANDFTGQGCGRGGLHDHRHQASNARSHQSEYNIDIEASRHFQLAIFQIER